jgi:hypothetical protein
VSLLPSLCERRSRMTRAELLLELEGIIAAAREVNRLAAALDEAHREITRLRNQVGLLEQTVRVTWPTPPAEQAAYRPFGFSRRGGPR